MKILSYLLVSIILYVLMSGSIYLTRTHREFDEKNKAHKAAVMLIVDEIMGNNEKVDYNDAVDIAEAFIEYGGIYNINVKDLLKIAWVESRFNHEAINKKSKDYGLMQINWRVWGSRFAEYPEQLLDIDTNVALACYIIDYNRKIGYKKLENYHSFKEKFAREYRRRLSLTDERFAQFYFEQE